MSQKPENKSEISLSKLEGIHLRTFAKERWLEANDESKKDILQNFSLMQTVGNMQRLKSRGLPIGHDKYEWMDRLDSFIFLLSKYFENCNNKTLLKDNAGANYQELCSYLSKYNSIYDYCHRVYFIQDELVDRLKENGGKHIEDEGVAKELILLANTFWQQKRDNLESKQ